MLLDNPDNTSDEELKLIAFEKKKKICLFHKPSNEIMDAYFYSQKTRIADDLNDLQEVMADLLNQVYQVAMFSPSQASLLNAFKSAILEIDTDKPAVHKLFIKEKNKDWSEHTIQHNNLTPFGQQKVLELVDTLKPSPLALG